jgi:predicted RNA-binding Zn-ribbon protein involved in translation (DUF1610 family)
MHNLHPGEWYLRFTCLQCGSKQILFPDLSNGKAHIQAVYFVKCLECGHKASYDTDTIERYYHPEKGQPVFSN